jgi:hypothetical protein
VLNWLIWAKKGELVDDYPRVFEVDCSVLSGMIVASSAHQAAAAGGQKRDPSIMASLGRQCTEKRVLVTFKSIVLAKSSYLLHLDFAW